MAIGTLFSLGCGFCLGWFLRGRPRFPKFVTKNALLKRVFEEYKLVLVMRNDLDLGKGKAVSQGAHASVLAYSKALKENPKILHLWEISGQTKVVVQVENEKSLLNIAKQAEKVGLITSLVHDAGRTQVAAGTKTVLGIGPGPKDLIDKVTGHLKLL